MFALKFIMSQYSLFLKFQEEHVEKSNMKATHNEGTAPTLESKVVNVMMPGFGAPLVSINAPSFSLETREKII